MSVVPANGTCPFDPTKLRCDPDCQLWVDKESCCAIRSAARSLRDLVVTLTEIQHTFEQQETI